MSVLSTILFALLAAAIGLGLLFFGYRAFLVLLPIFGFFGGFWLGAQAVSLLFGEGFLATVTGLVVGLVTGLIVAVLSYLIYWLGVGIVAGILGAGVTSGLMTAVGFDESGILVFIVSIVAAVIVAVLAMRYNLQKYVIITLTAIAGANAVLLALLVLIGRVPLETVQRAGTAVVPVLQDSWFWLLAWIALAAAGIYFQLRHNRTYTFQKEDYVEGWG